MGVDVDEPGGDHLAGGVELLAARQLVADGDDAPVRHRHIGPAARASCAVDQCSPPYHDVGVGHLA